MDTNNTTIYNCPRFNNKHSDVLFMGVPFELCETGMLGTKLGPNAIRNASLLYNYKLKSDGKSFGWFDIERNKHILENITFGDSGNIEIIPAEIEKNFDLIQKNTEEMLRFTNLLVTLGGDHSITLPLIKAVTNQIGNINIIHIDSHTDFADEWAGSRYNHGSTMRRISEIAKVKNIYQYGIRGLFLGLDNLKAAKDGKVKIVTTNDLRKGYYGTDLPNNLPYYITWDTDVFDPNYFPAVGVPNPNGINYEMIRGLFAKIIFGKKIVGMDVVELNPLFDNNRVCSLLVARGILDMLGYIFNPD